MNVSSLKPGWKIVKFGDVVRNQTVSQSVFQKLTPHFGV